MSTRIILEKNVEMPLRDGTVTRANVYQPEAGAPVPAILVRTPYSKNLLFPAKVHRRSELTLCLLDLSASRKRP